MADSFLAYQNPTTTDKKLDSESLTVGANVVERERIQVTGTAATDIAPVSSSLGLSVNVTNASIIVTQGTGTSLHTVIDNTAGAGSVNIQDGGNSITVDQATGTNLHTVIDSGTITTITNTVNDNILQFGSTNISTGTGAGGAGIPRVTVSNDSNILATQSGTWTVQQGGAPWSVTGSGTLTNNNLPPASNNVGVLPALVTAIPTSYTSGNQALLSLDLDGNLRTTTTINAQTDDTLFEILQELKEMKELLLSIAG